MGEKGEFPNKGLRNEILKVIILNHLSQQPGYPYALMKAMQSKKVWILQGLTKSDFYNAMNSLEKQGFIKGKTIMKGGKIQRNFEISAKGKKIVIASRKLMFKSFMSVKKLMNEELDE